MVFSLVSSVCYWLLRHIPMRALCLLVHFLIYHLNLPTGCAWLWMVTVFHQLSDCFCTVCAQ